MLLIGAGHGKDNASDSWEIDKAILRCEFEFGSVYRKCPLSLSPPAPHHDVCSLKTALLQSLLLLGLAKPCSAVLTHKPHLLVQLCVITSPPFQLCVITPPPCSAVCNKHAERPGHLDSSIRGQSVHLTPAFLCLCTYLPLCSLTTLAVNASSCEGHNRAHPLQLVSLPWSIIITVYFAVLWKDQAMASSI